MSDSKKRCAVALAVCLLVPVMAAADVAEIKSILKNLGGGDVRGLSQAAKKLGDVDIGSLADAALDDGGILESLSGLAGKTDKKVASRAASAAMERLGPEFGDRIEGLLDDPDMASKLFDSIGGLGEFGVGAAGGLLDVVGDVDVDPSLRSGAIDALGDIGSKGTGGSIEAALRKASEDSNADIAGSAKKALGKLD